MSLIGLRTALALLLLAVPLGAAAQTGATVKAKGTEPLPAVVPFADATFLFPAGAKVAVRWVLPPGGETSMGGMLSVDAEGNALFGSSWEGRIMNPAKGYLVTLKPYDLRGLTHLANGVLLLAVGNDIGLLAAPAQRVLKDGVPVAGFQPLAHVPLQRIEVFASSGNTVYCAGEAAGGTGGHALYMLRTAEGAGPQDIQKLFDSAKEITAVTGDDEAVFVALGRDVVRISRRDGSVTPLYTHPSANVKALALTPAGLVASTGTELVLIGPKGSLEFMRSGGHHIYARGATLYVSFGGSLGVLALDNLGDLRRFNLAVRPAAAGERTAPLAVAALRFFESGPPPYARRDFADSFDRGSARRIVAQIDYRSAASLTGAGRHTLTVSWFEPTGGRLTTVNYPITLGSGAPTGQILASIGQEEGGKGYIPRSRGEGGMIWIFGKDALGARYPGRYRVQVQADGIPLGEWGFTLTGAAKPYEAMAYNDPAMLRTLLAQGWNPRVKDADGGSPIHQAGIFGTTEMMEMLLKAGADPNGTDKEGNPPLAIAHAWFPDWRAKAELLVRHGANVNAKDKDGQPLLFLGAYKGFPAFLLDHGANVNVRDIHFKATPAENLLSFGFCKEPVLSALIKRGVDVGTTKNSLGRTPLGEAIFMHEADCAELLLSKKVALGKAEKAGMEQVPHSVLFAALKGADEAAPENIVTADRIVRLLLDQGALLNPGEGWIMIRGKGSRFFDRAALLRVLQEEEALREGLASPDPAIQEIALGSVAGSVRRMTARAGDTHELRTAYRQCQDGYKLLRGDPMSQPDLILACGVVEKALGENGIAAANLGRWLAANPKAEQAEGVRALLEGRPLADTTPSWGASPGRPGSAGCTMQ